ncbi:hypothetical protein GOBAR_AA21013 [Gossypium barbadense]|uniref:non-specific serine/threonine protein kinase n=1 Tax=Gossypium barbadense TaxID=3634 RepID=A0A2P5X8H6_GOSBA|nr:hypothetical protein GOBAR_AA21013 [Gossypium barbadense]
MKENMTQRLISFCLWLIFVLDLAFRVAGNAEGDALNALKTNMVDPNNVLQSWDPTLVNPCTWFHVTCNSENSVTRVDLGNANLTGQLVPQLGSLPNLQYLELYSNNISGTIPDELGNLTELVSLDLYLNKLTGDIPTTLGQLKKLRFFLGSYENFLLVLCMLNVGISRLGHTERVDRRRLNNNSLAGTIPRSLTTIDTLQVLDLSNNGLVGDVPVNGSFSLFTPISFANNKLNNPPPAPPPPIPPTPPAQSGISSTGAIAGGVAAGAALLFAAPAIVLALWRKRKAPDHFFDVPAEEDPEVHLGQLKRFSLRELQVATDNFSNKNILGRGGFGKVYKGRLADGSLVAVKRLKEERTQGGELQFQTEVEMISMAVHRNLLRLRGFCMTPTERLLVYPFMVNGSVASCLRLMAMLKFQVKGLLKERKLETLVDSDLNGNYIDEEVEQLIQVALFLHSLERSEFQPALDWAIRKRIALGAARGLAYLHDHCDPKIIHRDVKAANILLDEEFEAVVGDFGLAKLMDYKDTHVTTAVRGTIGHIAPEYLSTGKSSEKTDVFGYGVMLLELITGQRAFDLARLANDDDVMLLDWLMAMLKFQVKGLLKERKLETLVDSDLNGNYIDEEVEQLIQVALLCTQGTPMERPKMSEVVRMLEGDGLAERWEEWQKEEMVRQEFNQAHHYSHHQPNANWIIADSTSHIPPDELSGPR